MKLALVTGASSGLGLELCKLLEKRGYCLLVTGRQNLPLAHVALQADLVHERHKVLDLIHQYTPDLVINNAGFSFYGSAIDQTLDILEVNAKAPIEITIEAARALKAKNKPGIILNVSSAAALLSMPNMALYAAAKACLTSFSQSFDAEMRSFGIRILTALPGQIDTPFAERASRGQFQQKSGLKKEYVAERIWRQIEKKKRIEIIDWKYRLWIFLAKLFPRISERVIAKSLSKRTNATDSS